MTTLFRASIALHGTTPLYDRKNAAQVLDVLDARGLTPQKAGLEERAKKPYERDGVLGLLSERPTAFAQTKMYLWRTARLKYMAWLALWDEARIVVEFEPTPPPTEWQSIFELGDALAAVFQPDWGAAGIAFDLRADVRRAPADADEMDACLVTASTSLDGLQYRRSGPSGLSWRTYIGPFFVEQFGRERIESLPLVVEKLAWGGYRIDLVPEPWKADFPTVLEAWRRGMAHLRDANVFPSPVLDLGHLARFKRAANLRLRDAK